MNKKIEYLTKKIEYVYPNNIGKAEIRSINIIVKKEDAQKLDELLNTIYSQLKACGEKVYPIYDYQGAL